jgi:hypothetical protein
MKYLYIFVIITLIIFSGNYLFSQEKGEISGTVVDNFNQNIISDAVIEISGINQKTTTNQFGKFKFSNIEFGTYSLKFSALGYVPFIIDNIIVSSGMPAIVNAKLELTATDEIIVEADRFLKPDDMSTSFKNLQFEEIRRNPGGFEDIGRVVQGLPGVSFVNDGRNDLIVRGGSPSENLFLIDNSPIRNINHFGSQGSTGGPVSMVNLSLIKEVNFITGGFSARYGDKLSSVLEVDLREGSREKFIADLNLSGTGVAGILEGPLGKKGNGSWLFSIKRSYLDLIFNAAGFGFIPEYTSAEIKAVYDINTYNKITINALTNYDKIRFNNDTRDNIEKNQGILKNNQIGYFTSFEWKSILSNKFFILVDISRNFTKFDFTGKDTAQVENFSNQSEEGETQVKSEFYWYPLKKTQILFGLGEKFIKFINVIKSASDTLNFIDPNTGHNFIIPEVNFNSTNNTTKSFAYIQLNQKLFHDAEFSVGLRFDYFDFIQTKNYFSPRTSLSIPLIHNLNLNLSYGIFYQSPSYIWLVSNPENKKLSDIRADHYIAGFDYLVRSDLKLTLEFYYKKYSNYPVSNIRPYFILSNNGGDFERMDNFGLEPLSSLGVGFSRGIELYLQKAFTNDFYTNVSISVFEAKYTSLDGIERISDFDNQFLLILNGGYKLGRNWEFSSKLRWFGGRPFTPISSQNGTQLVSQYNSSRYPNFSSLDIRMDKRWNFSKWSLVAYVDIQNILNKKNIANYEWNKYKHSIDTNNNIGILPTIGINAIF